MKNKELKIKSILLLLTAFLLVSLAGCADKKNEEKLKEMRETIDTLNADKKLLQELNRSSIENMVLQEGDIYVIGHKSPDSDTVCTAIAYAHLLNELGYKARPAITMPINHESEYILKEAGVEVPEELADASGLNIFLVDHSEYSQAAEGMIDAHIVGVIDHHGIGSVATGNQVVYEARPIGATATIVWLDYLNYGVEIPQKIAHILLGAILSDTSNLTVSTTTEADRKALPYLAEIAGVEDIDAFYKELHTKALSYEGMSDEEILFQDYKEYEAGDTRFGIGLLNAIDLETASALAVRMKQALADYGSTKDVSLIYASVGMRENGEKIDYIVPGNELSETVLKNAFPDYDEYDGTAYIFKKGLGRKSKFVPGLTDYLMARPHE